MLSTYCVDVNVGVYIFMCARVCLSVYKRQHFGSIQHKLFGYIQNNFSPSIPQCGLRYAAFIIDNIFIKRYVKAFQTVYKPFESDS